MITPNLKGRLAGHGALAPVLMQVSSQQELAFFCNVNATTFLKYSVYGIVIMITIKKISQSRLQRFSKS